MKKEFLEEALRLARLSYDDGEVPVGAVVTIGDKIIGTHVHGHDHVHIV